VKVDDRRWCPSARLDVAHPSPEPPRFGDSTFASCAFSEILGGQRRLSIVARITLAVAIVSGIRDLLSQNMP
jgi:hypothetical protein